MHVVDLTNFLSSLDLALNRCICDYLLNQAISWQLIGTVYYVPGHYLYALQVHMSPPCSPFLMTAVQVTWESSG